MRISCPHPALVDNSGYRHYIPATSKVLSIIDKGVRDRVTKNGETLRRHAESAQRWKNLRDRISRTDADMQVVRKRLTETTPSEAGSSTVSLSRSSLGTPESESRSSRSSKALSRSISPFRKFARKIAASARHSPRASPPQLPPVTPLTITKNGARSPVSEPPRALRRQRSSILVGQANASQTPERLGHKHSHSLTLDPETSSDSTRGDAAKSRPQTLKQPWNSSTKVQPEERSLTLKGTPTKRAPSVLGSYSQGDTPPVPQRRSLSRSSMAFSTPSSRPWSPVTSSGSTSMSSTHPPLMPIFRPPSRAQTPSHSTMSAVAMTPRSRPKTPSYIPAPAKRSMSAPYYIIDDDNTSPKSRPFSPSLSFSGASAAYIPPRPPSRSMIPIPSLQLSSSSRPSTSLSNYDKADSPTTSTFKTLALRAQTPECTLREKLQQVPVFHGSVRQRSSIQHIIRAPPSSYKDGTPSRAPSRSVSRAGAFTPALDGIPLHEYTVGNVKDPLDVEVGAVVNSIPHGLLIERIDPPLRKIPKEGEEIKAQYAFSTTLGRKIVTCRLTTMTRSGKAGETTRKVMCRVGGGVYLCALTRGQNN